VVQQVPEWRRDCCGESRVSWTVDVACGSKNRRFTTASHSLKHPHTRSWLLRDAGDCAVVTDFERQTIARQEHYSMMNEQW